MKSTKNFFLITAAALLLFGCDGGDKSGRRVEDLSADTGAHQSSYPTKANPVVGDKVLITDSEDGYKTKQANIGSISQVLGLGDVVTDVAYSSLAAADAAAVAAGKTLVISKQWNTVPSNLSSNIRMVTGGKLNTSGAITFTGSFEADDSEHFPGSGSITGLKIACPEWWSAPSNDPTVDSSAAFAKAFAASKNIYAHGRYGIGSSVTWPTSRGWSLKGDKGTSKLIALNDTPILQAPAGDLGQYGNIEGIIFDADTKGQGTAIYGASTTYVAHLKVIDCNFTEALKIGITGILIEVDIDHNLFGLNTSAVVGTKNFTPIIITAGLDASHASNVNRITKNEIVNANGVHAVSAVGGVEFLFKNNTLENNATTGSVVYTEQLYNFIHMNHFERNGSVPMLEFVGSFSSSQINEIHGNFINVRDVSSKYIIDITNLTYPCLSLVGNTFTGQQNVVKRGSSYDPLSVVSKRMNNSIVPPLGYPASPYAPSALINGGAFDTGFNGPLDVERGVSVGGDLCTKGTIYNQTIKLDVLATETPTTAFELPLISKPATYLITATSHRVDVTNFGAFAIIITDDATGRFVSRMPVNSSGTNLTITMSGNNVVVEQTSGSSINNVYVTATRIN